MIRSPLLLGSRSVEDRLTRLGVARCTVGSSALVTSVATRLFGVPPDEVTATGRMTTRLFGIRNIALGAWALAVRDAGGDERRRCVELNAAVDIADIAVVAPYLLRSGLRRAALMACLLGGSAALGWMELLEEL